MLPEILHIQNHETRVKGISRVCIAIILFSIFDTIIYLFLGLYSFSLLTGVIGLFFGGVFILNKKGYYEISRTSLIVATNLGVLIFSTCLGFKSGIYLYLFAAPLLTYMLYDFKQKLQVYLSFVSYIVTFILTFLIDKVSAFGSINVNDDMLSLLYNVNIIFSFILCFVLISYFSHNNSNYTDLLINSKEIIQEQKHLLEKEIKNKDILNRELNETLNDKVLLLSEIHHRVKNNLAVVSGLIELQTAYIDDKKTLLALKESQNRVKSIALLHEKLYENKTLKEVNMSDYIHELTQFIKQSCAPDKKEIKVISQIDAINLEMNQAMPFALLLNELMSNSYKYAFTNKEKGSIEIKFKKQLNNYIFDFKDDGTGFDYDKEINKDSLGLNLIGSFSEQLNGKFEYIKKESGMHFVLKF